MSGIVPEYKVLVVHCYASALRQIYPGSYVTSGAPRDPGILSTVHIQSMLIVLFECNNRTVY